MLISFNSLDSLFCMSSSNSSDHNSLKTRMLEHLLVITVDNDAFEMDFGPFSFFLDGSEGGDEFSARSAVVKVEGVTSAHATEACYGDLELRRGHFAEGRLR
jgi:hypothetical protein